MSAHLVSTVAVQSACGRCRVQVLVGWAEGLQAKVDATPTDPAGELHALLDNRWTYERARTGELIYRDFHRIRSGPPAAGVYVEHRCAAPNRTTQPALFTTGGTR